MIERTVIGESQYCEEQDKYRQHNVKELAGIATAFIILDIAVMYGYPGFFVFWAFCILTGVLARYKVFYWPYRQVDFMDYLFADVAFAFFFIPTKLFLLAYWLGKRDKKKREKKVIEHVKE